MKKLNSIKSSLLLAGSFVPVGAANASVIYDLNDALNYNSSFGNSCEPDDQQLIFHPCE